MMKAKIYQFPQGEEKAQVKAEIARIKNAPVVEKRKRWLWSFFLTLFFVLRLVVAFIADMALTLAVVFCGCGWPCILLDGKTTFVFCSPICSPAP